ncbi:thiosulfate sulfurtransferase [Bacterioplanes sanyensis]|uniref:Thiosulfate sulfurtransferase GlpE n=2 Tax=Bacterioplanes sanyensis TaxID=1249553 RepID=A0A222FQJ4_9GAMM|nr:thiosulfate sulfurtransferase GlpE [Bacterioplanes sanyensis]ASP40786.1 thiosulfate sulfurtransferase [Bacterioplanes sanyensis]
MVQFQHLSAQDARPMIENQQATVADTRDVMSYTSGHISGAQPLDNSNLSEFIANTDKSKPLIVCCYHGNSSQGAAQYLASQGFEQVYSLDGGYELWKITHPDLCESS